MTWILQCLVWISVLSATRSQSTFYNRQNQRSISFPGTRTHENYYHSHQTLNSALERPKPENRVTGRPEGGYRIQVNKRGALPESSEVVFPGPSTKSRYAPHISEECHRRGYCEVIPNYPKEQVRDIINKLGDDLKFRLQSDELDTDVQVAQRFGSEGVSFGLCETDPERLLIPDSLPDRNNVWWTVLQDRDNNMTQAFRAETCKDSAIDKSCSPLAQFPPGYTSKCVQKYAYRSVLVVDNNKAVAQKSLRLPSCCSCVVSTL